MHLIVSTIIAASTSAAAALMPADGVDVKLAPKLVAQGQIAVLRVRPSGGAPAPEELTGRAEEQPLRFFDCPSSAAERCALVAVAVDAKPGTMDVSVSWFSNGTPRSRSLPLKVRRARFQESKLKVEPAITNPTPEDLKRIERERAEIAAIYAAGSPVPLWDAGFALPGKGGITSKFGNRRSFNGEVKSIHQGVDLRAATGAPIYAANAGKVAFAKETFYAGNMVILDHGAGIFSLYAHMSAFAVKAGDAVRKGDLLGKAGATGRVTGPHLHWGARVNNTLVDPLQLKAEFNRLWGKG